MSSRLITTTPFVLVLALSTAAWPQDAPQHRVHEILIAAGNSFHDGDMDGVRQNLRELEATSVAFLQGTDLKYYRLLKYQVAAYDVGKGDLPSPDALRAYRNNYEALSECYVQELADYRKAGRDSSYGETFADWQSLARQYAGTLQGAGLHEEAMAALSSAAGMYAASRDLLEKPCTTIVIDPETGRRSETATTFGKKYQVADAEELQEQRIRVARDYYDKITSSVGKECLMRVYQEYVDAYPTHTRAGLYLNCKMQLEGHVDLDALTAIYRRCETQDAPQYQGLILGLANLLIDAERTEEALTFLKQVREDLLPSARLAELYYALGRSYFAAGRHKEALQHLLAVRTMTTRYGGVNDYIEAIVGDPNTIANQTLRDLVLDDNSRGKTTNEMTGVPQILGNTMVHDANDHRNADLAGGPGNRPGGPEATPPQGLSPNISHALQRAMVAVLAAASIALVVIWKMRRQARGVE